MEVHLSHPAAETAAKDRRHHDLATLGLAALNVIGLPMLLLSAGGTLLYANPLGRLMLRSGGALQLRGECVRGATPAEHAEFDAALARCAQGLRTLMLLRGCAGAAVIPVPDDDEKPCALVLFGAAPAASHLGRYLFGARRALTPSELHVLDQLCSGRNAEEIAADNGVQLSTVRSQISSLREKTGARSIPHLLLLASGLPPIGPQVV
jgi:DNA-binding CsgD family transcriptional regulator